MACPQPFGVARVEITVTAGPTLAELLDLAGVRDLSAVHAHVSIDGWPIAREHWRVVRPKPGRLITVRVVPALGGGSGGKKSPLRIILSLAVVAASFVLGPMIGGWLGAAVYGTELGTAMILGQSAVSVFNAVGSGLVGLVGNLLVNAIAPAPRPQLAAVSGVAAAERTSPTLAITGAQNRANPYGAVPRVYGRHRVMPPYAAAPYTEVVGSDQYLRLLFDFGYGPLQLSDHRIGTTPLAQFEGVETEVRQGYPDDAPITLYSHQMPEDAYSLVVTAAGGPQVIESRDDADEIGIDLACDGLIIYDANGNGSAWGVGIAIAIRAAGSGGAWTDMVVDTPQAQTPQLVRFSYRFGVPARGRYEVRVTRTTSDNESNPLVRDRLGITALRTIRWTPPTSVTGHCLVALRIKATGQLNGIVSSYSAIAEALLPAWDGDAFGAPAVTRSPAWAALDVLRGSANKRPIADARIDLDSFLDLATACAVPAQDGAPRCLFDAVFDARTTVVEAVNDILATCRAALAMRDGRFAVVRDRPQSVPVQMFTPRNSWGFSATKVFVQRPHALKVRHINPAKDWAQDEVTVYADGYDAGNATLYETVDLWGVTRPAQAWRDGRFLQAVSKLRPEVYELSADIEHLVCGRGDLVRVAHDVPRWGLAWGRVKSVSVDSGAIVALTLDEAVTLEPGRTYAVRVRNGAGDQATATIAPVTVATASATITLAQTMAEEAAAAGDLAVVGEAARETAELVVKSIRRLGDFNARLELLDAAAAVHSADAGPIPDFDPQSTWPGQGALAVPGKPLVESLRSDELALVPQPGGGWQAAILIVLGARSGVAVPVSHLEVQRRRTGAGEPWTPTLFAGTPSSISLAGVDELVAYDLRLRWVTPAGRASDWTLIDAHLVVGRSTPPPAPSGLRVSDGRLVADYPDPPRDFAGFVVRWQRGNNRSLTGAVQAHVSPSVPMPFDLAGLPGGTMTLLVTAIDTTGNESVPAIVVRDLDGPLVANIIDTIDLAAAGFPGTIAGGAVAGGELRADGDTTLYLPTGAGLYLPDGDADYLAVQYEPMSWTAVVVPDSIHVPSQLTVAAEVAASAWQVDMRADDLSLYLPDSGDPYLPDDGPYLGGPPAWVTLAGAVDARRVRTEIRLRTDGGPVRGVVSAFELRFDVPDEEEEIEDLVVPAAGIRLPLTRSYREIRHVALTLQHDGNDADTLLLMDKDASLGPLVQALRGGLPEDALIDARIKGVRG